MVDCSRHLRTPDCRQYVLHHHHKKRSIQWSKPRLRRRRVKRRVCGSMGSEHISRVEFSVEIAESLCRYMDNLSIQLDEDKTHSGIGRRAK